MLRRAQGARSQQGLTRREMIRAAAVAGAAAWTAPVIIDSLASPAAAFTPPTGCFYFTFNGGSCSFDNQSPCGDDTHNADTCSRGSDALQACLQITPATSNCQDGVIVDNECAPACSFVAAFGEAHGNASCLVPGASMGGFLLPNQIRFTNNVGGTTVMYDQFTVYISCGP